MVAFKAGLPHAGINSTGLVRLLAGLGITSPGVAGPGMARPSGADKLGHWLDWTDDIALSAALAHKGLTTGDGAAPAQPVADIASVTASAQAARAALSSLRAEGVQAITAEPLWSVPAGPAGEPVDPAPYRQAYQAQQRAMSARCGSLRDLVRQMLFNAGPPLARLAALDAVLDKGLAGRERQLLSALPSLMEKHFKSLHLAQAAGWLEAYGQDMQAVLMAELDIRLLPIEGMMQALRTLAERQTPVVGKPQAAAA